MIGVGPDKVKPYPWTDALQTLFCTIAHAPDRRRPMSKKIIAYGMDGFITPMMKHFVKEGVLTSRLSPKLHPKLW